MLFEGNGILSSQTNQFVQQTQQIAVVAGLPFGPLEHFPDVFERMFDLGNAVAHQKSADGGPADHGDFIWQGLEDDGHLAPRHQIAAKNHDEDEDDTCDTDHRTTPLPRWHCARP